MSTFAQNRPAALDLGYAPDYRLTRRGRLVVLFAGLAVLLAIGVAFAGVSLASGEPAPTETIVVAPGDTLWDISSDLSASGDVRETMRHIEQLNSLDTVSLTVGQRLQVPVG
ncbi:MAG: LysM peptidoglycan-binding domain-containing protein [Nocardioides sp.]